MTKYVTIYPKPSKGPDMNELTNSLSRRILDFLHPILDTSSIVWVGVKASIVRYEVCSMIVEIRTRICERARCGAGSLKIDRNV